MYAEAIPMVHGPVAKNHRSRTRSAPYTKATRAYHTPSAALTPPIRGRYRMDAPRICVVSFEHNVLGFRPSSTTRLWIITIIITDGPRQRDNATVKCTYQTDVGRNTRTNHCEAEAFRLDTETKMCVGAKASRRCTNQSSFVTAASYGMRQTRAARFSGYFLGRGTTLARNALR
ncbi:hypothetical protein CPC08DRAFT_339501 [Agrocybe pediades]|nr:hypothetical protein CPC08DRAFT_339501 [Agrocybe pediades]